MALVFEQRIEILKALADSSRLAVVNALMERPHCAEELATRLQRAPSTITFHLKKLEESGLIARSRNQYYGIFELKTEVLDFTLREFIAHPASDDSIEQKRLRSYREKVIRTFIKRGRLLQLPKQWKKRRIVLDEFVGGVDRSKLYTEGELNVVIEPFYQDYCTLRRLLLDEGYLSRDGRQYWFESGPETMENRAEIKRAYKESPKQAGVFQIKNTATGRVYLGSSLNLHGPLNKHRFMLKIGRHDVAALQKDYIELGPDAFLFEVLEVVTPKDDPGFRIEDELSKLEQAWVERTEPFGPRGYNTSKRIRE